MPDSKTIRIGAVGYLNSKPLIEDLPQLLPEAELLLDYPSRLADQLAAGEIDVGLIPVVECLRNPDYKIVSDACVASRGPVLSVKLLSRVPINEIRTLALDEGSRTSAVLVRILLRELAGVDPERRPLPLGDTATSTETDAVLLIGDRAMHKVAFRSAKGRPFAERKATLKPFIEEWDLGEEWTRWTGLPFVFAVWAARQSTDTGALEAALSAARDRGVSRLREIAMREAPKLEIDQAMALDYLTMNLHFRLGPDERAGLEQFITHAASFSCQTRPPVSAATSSG